MAERGRPPKGVERSSILLRMPTDLMEQVDAFKECLEAERGGFGINRTDMLIRLIEVGLQTLTQARQPAPHPAPASHVNGQGAPAPQPTAQPAIPLALEPAPKIAQPVPVPQAQETPSATAEPIGAQTLLVETPVHHGRPGISRETLQAIADERTLCEGLSIREFSQRLFDKGIYRAKAKDGRAVPVDHSRLRRWLDQTREAGLL
jgi:hypothetical protein